MGKNTDYSRRFVPAQNLFEMSSGYYRDKGVSTYNRSALNADATGNPFFFKRFFCPETIAVVAIIIPVTTAIATTVWDFNLGFFSEYTSGSDSLPYGLVDPVNGQGVLSLPINVSNEVNHRLLLPGRTILEGGYEYFVGFQTLVGGLNAGAVAIHNTIRAYGNLNASGGYTRYDLKSSTNIAYSSGTLATPFASIAGYTDGLSGLQNLEFTLQTERL